MTSKTIGTLLIAGALVLGGCGSDDDGGDTPDTMTPGTPDMTSGTPQPSGDIFALAARMDGDDPAPLDRATLQGQLDALLGDADADDPLSLEEGDTVTTALRRRETGR